MVGFGAVLLFYEHSRAKLLSAGWNTEFARAMPMKRILLLFAGCLFLHSAMAQPADDLRLQTLFTNYLERLFTLKPTEATGLGDHRFDARLDDISPEARKRWRALSEETLANLPKQVDYKKLSRDSQIDYEIWQHDLELANWLDDNIRPFERDPRTYGGYLSDSVYLLLTQD